MDDSLLITFSVRFVIQYDKIKKLFIKPGIKQRWTNCGNQENAGNVH